MTENQHRDALTPGFKLHWYVIDRVLGQGGFGITYLARDTNLDQMVAIKEFLPGEIALRVEDVSVQPRTANDSEQYEWGLDRFMSEARTLARFDHPNIARIFSVFEANDTAYLVMRYEQGKAFNTYLEQHQHLSEEELLDIALPILDGLKEVHKTGFIHRDIQPANIYIRDDGSPVLLDFGAARDTSGKLRTLTILVAPGYAPFEQYYTNASEQGPWTDIYGMGATLYRAITGVAPLDAIERSRGMLGSTRDLMVPASVAGQGRYSERFLAAVDHALKFNDQDRPRTIDVWIKELEPLPAETTDSPKTNPEPSNVTPVIPENISPGVTPEAINAAIEVNTTKRTLAFIMIFTIGIGLGMLILQYASDEPSQVITENIEPDSIDTTTGTTPPVTRLEQTVPVTKANNSSEIPAPDLNNTEATNDESVTEETNEISRELMDRIASLENQIDVQNQRAEDEKKAEAEALKSELKILEDRRKQEQDKIAALEEERRIAEQNKIATLEEERRTAEQNAVNIIKEEEVSSENDEEIVLEKPAAVATEPVVEDSQLQTGIKAITEGSFATALELLEPLASKGDARAQYNVALLYWTGRGVLANNNTALDWMIRAARQGQKEAQLELARMYSNGINGVTDHFLAYIWYLVLEKNGNYDAVSERRDVEAELQSEQIPQAASMATELQTRQIQASVREVMIE
jgi:serine/threonine protein kinase